MKAQLSNPRHWGNMVILLATIFAPEAAPLIGALTTDPETSAAVFGLWNLGVSWFKAR